MYIPNVSAAMTVTPEPNVNTQNGGSQLFSQMMELVRNPQTVEPYAVNGKSSERFIERLRAESKMHAMQIQNRESEEDLRRKAWKIYMRLLRGETVSPAEMSFLMQHAPGLYFQAMMMLQLQIEPEEADSLIEGEAESVTVSLQAAGDGG